MLSVSSLVKVLAATFPVQLLSNAFMKEGENVPDIWEHATQVGDLGLLSPGACLVKPHLEGEQVDGNSSLFVFFFFVSFYLSNTSFKKLKKWKTLKSINDNVLHIMGRQGFIKNEYELLAKTTMSGNDPERCMKELRIVMMLTWM